MSEAPTEPSAAVSTPAPAPAVDSAAAAAATTGSAAAAKDGLTRAVEEAVVAQVEFYLSDSNLPFDKYLYDVWSRSFHQPASIITSTADEPSSNPSTLIPHPESTHPRAHLGWIPLSLLTSFKRMAPYLAPPPTGLGSIDAVAKVVKDHSSLVQVRHFGTDDSAEEGKGWYVRKSVELKRPQDTLERSVYVKGFPVEELSSEDSSERKKEVKDKELKLQVKLEQWAKALGVGKVVSLRMRREDRSVPAGKTPVKGGGKFKGSVFIEYDSAGAVTKFLALDPKPTFEPGKELEIKSKATYVEEKRLIYAPDSKPFEKPSVPVNPYKKSAKPYNAWATKLISESGWPALDPKSAAAREGGGSHDDGKKRKADDDGPEERQVLFDGVRYTARRSNGQVEIVDEDKVGTGEGEWPTGKVLRFVISKKDGSTQGDKETGTRFNHLQIKEQLSSLIKVGFVELVGAGASSRPIVNLAPGKDTSMNVDAPQPSEFSEKLSAPPTIKSSTQVKSSTSEPSSSVNPEEYPAQCQATFREHVTDELLEKIQSKVSEYEGRKVEWRRATPEEERAHVIGRARYHAGQAFAVESRQDGGRGGGRGGRGGRGGGRGGGGRGGGNKRQRRD